ncbi:hypothetical protein QQP08_006194 [Theobroma cacao]|uniref:Uncharacterized protein n=1 Tax=Theobroma cacao TaxID=3641 RepID=A0A061E9S9_THECC|nr:Uncharacterized protein TCM_011511 [Theobroma cacao]WRX13707.1 hypothetical protein QQP08_006194 [Theobroma cacao]
MPPFLMKLHAGACCYCPSSYSPLLHLHHHYPFCMQMEEVPLLTQLIHVLFDVNRFRIVDSISGDNMV